MNDITDHSAQTNMADYRQEYALDQLEIDQMSSDPIEQFKGWWQAAVQTEREPNAMCVSTVSANGRPSSRIVLLKGLDSGFVFYTNYNSQKGEQLLANPWACLNFFWQTLERQVRVEGQVEKLARAESEKYFNSRPVGSQYGAMASPQSQVIHSRSLLENRLADVKKQPPLCPDHWGGYRLIADRYEFWQGRRNRLHDRVLYRPRATTDDTHDWQRQRLAP